MMTPLGPHAFIVIALGGVALTLLGALAIGSLVVAIRASHENLRRMDLLAGHLEGMTRQADVQAVAVAEIGQHVVETKVAAAQAYQEANDVNLKIEDLNARLLKQGDHQAATSVATENTLSVIHDSGEDTNERVRDIQQTQKAVGETP